MVVMSFFCRVIKVAKDFVGKVNFAVSDKSDYTNELEALGLDSNADVVVGAYDTKGKYAMTEKFRSGVIYSERVLLLSLIFL